MFPAENILLDAQKRLKSRAICGPSAINWDFSKQAISVLPVFSELPQQTEQVLEQLFSLGMAKMMVMIDYRLPEEDKVFGRLIYHVSAIRDRTCRFDQVDEKRDDAAVEAALETLNDQYLHQIGFSHELTSEMLNLHMDIPVTDVEVHEQAPPVQQDELEAKIPDREMRITLVELFLEQADHRLDDWRAKFDQGEITECHRLIHSLKGSALNVSAHRLAHMARRLELQLKINHTEDAKKLYSAIEREMAEVKNSLREYLATEQD